MDRPPSSHLWLGRFCVRLMQLRQDISLPRAVTRAVAAFAHASRQVPEVAAEIDFAVATRAAPQPQRTIGRMPPPRPSDETR